MLGTAVLSAQGQSGQTPAKASVAPAKPAAESCDLKKVVKMDYCPECQKILLKGDLDAKGQCRACGDQSKVEKVDVCCKTAYACCGKQAVEAFVCEKCGEDATAKDINALVIYVCKGCGAKASKAGNCSGTTCANAGKPLTRTCELSGTFPHVGVKS